MAEIDRELFLAYIEDFEEQVQILENDLVAMELEGPTPDIISEIFRAAHTIKGSSAMVGFGLIEKLSHAMENLLAGLRDGDFAISDSIVAGLFASVDSLNRLREQLPNLEQSDETVDELISRLNTLRDEALGKTEEASVGAQEVSVGAQEVSVGAQKVSVGAQEVSIGAQKVSVEPGEQADSREPESTSTVSKKAAVTAVLADGGGAGAGDGKLIIEIELEPICMIPSVRAAQILSLLVEIGTVVDSDPTTEDIEADRIGDRLLFVLDTKVEEDRVREVLTPVGDIASLSVTALGEDGTSRGDEVSGGGEASVAPSVVQLEPEIVPQKTAEIPAPVQEESGPVTPPAAAPPAKDRPVRRIKISVERLDSLMNLVGEVVIHKTRLEQLVRTLEKRFEKDHDILSLSATSGQINFITNILKDQIIKARLVPVANLFRKFPRLVRDVARKANRKVDFIVQGEETELDRTVIEEIEDPLVHMLRNAVDHGLESPEERLAAGKSERGIVTLSASHQEDRIIITIEDDGGGIDLERVKAKALEAGIISPDAVGRLSERECLDLIFAPGFTTKDSASEVSGRGVGMDIVRSNLERLSGNVFVATELGKGSRFVVRLPLTLAIIKVLLISLADYAYAIPLISVDRTLRIKRDEIQLIKGTETVFLAGDILPLLRLRSVFDMDDEACDQQREQLNVVVVSWSDRKIGFVVDYPIGEHEIVIKPLGDYIGEVPGISGATILGDGRIALIMDVPSLVKSILKETML